MPVPHPSSFPQLFRLLAGVLLFSITLGSLAGAITAEAAQTKIKPYFGSNADTAGLVASPPLSYNDEVFYVFYFHTNIPRRVVAVVNGETGALEDVPARLDVLGASAYRLDVTTYRLDPQLTFNEFSGFLSATKNKADSVSTALPSVRTQITSYASTVDISDIEAKLGDLNERLTNAQGSVTEGARLQSEFSRDSTVESLNNYYDQYTAMFDDTQVFFDSATAYDASIKAKAASVNKDATLTVDQKRNINTALSSLSLDGDGSLLSFRTRVFEPGKAEFEDLKTGQDAWVNASLDGFGFLRAKTDAENLQAQLAPDITTLKANKAAYTACNADPTDAIKTYDDGVKQIKQAADTSSMTIYQSAVASLSTLPDTIQGLKDTYAACKAPTPVPGNTTPKTNNDWVLPVMVLLIILAGAWFVYNRMKTPGAEGGDAGEGTGV